MLLGRTLGELASLLGELNAAPYRTRQLHRGLYHQGIEDIGDLTTFPRRLRQELAERAFVGRPRVLASETGADETLKLLLGLHDRERVEAVAIPAGRRRTACLSTQVGCGLGCVFCATGQMGLRRNLRAGEMLGQFLALTDAIEPEAAAGSRRRNESDGRTVTNVVFMGMGEPLANYRETLRAVRLLNDPDAIGLAARKIRISTVGLPPQIVKLARERLELGLTISLAAPRDELRDRLVPVNRTHPLRRVLGAADRYGEITGRMVTFAYILIPGINDSMREGRELVSLLKGRPCKLNLLPLNPHPALPGVLPGRPASRGRPREMGEHPLVPYLTSRLPHVTFRRSRGLGISAACGQLYLAQRASRRAGGRR